MVDRGTDARVTFMHLPQEVRNRIYSLALAHGQSLHISRHVKNPAANGKSGYKTASRLVVESVLSCRDSHDATMKEVVAVGLLRTTKAVNTEAYAVLLRENHFTFQNSLALQVFVFALGSKVKTLANVVVKTMSRTLANEQICVLSLLDEPKTISVVPAMLENVWDPRSTWTLIKPIVWRMEQPLKVGMSVRPVVSQETQRQRLAAIEFNMSRSQLVFVGKSDIMRFESPVERGNMFKALVQECWQEDAKAVGVRKVREPSPDDEGWSKRLRRV